MIKTMAARSHSSDRVRVCAVPRDEADARVERTADGSVRVTTRLRGAAVLRHPMTNKGTAFTLEERDALRLHGLLPPQVSSLEEQLERAYAAYSANDSAMAKHTWLRALQDTQEVLYYALLERHLTEMLPIVYTPTVGDAVRNFHRMHQAPRGLSLPGDDPDRIRQLIADYPDDDLRMIVATDSSAILGIGDRGHGGLAISIGKLALYTVAGGVAPEQTLPVVIDMGTDRQELLDDPLYLGARHRRLDASAHARAVDAFVDAVRLRWPRAIIQWEDFAKDTAFDVLARHRYDAASFNDDIQGTGAVALAGVLAACALKGERLADQRVVIHGAGAGGAGVAWAIRQGMLREGLSEDEARRRLFVLDSRGLLIAGRPMEPYKQALAQEPADVEGWGTPDLLGTIERARATVLLGLSGQTGAFDEPILRAVAANTERPIVFALSNPTSSSEAVPADVLAVTEGRAIVATGSPFDDVELGGRRYAVGQGNNAFVFPGLGMGALLSDAMMITDSMVLAGAYALAEYTTRHGDGRVYPPVSALREVAVDVAVAVMQEAVKSGVGRWPAGAVDDAAAYVRHAMFEARYRPVVPA